jgi:hypothetical protein
MYHDKSVLLVDLLQHYILQPRKATAGSAYLPTCLLIRVSIRLPEEKDEAYKLFRRADHDL